jgi:3-methyladenine DNA glycosylase AlkD
LRKQYQPEDFQTFYNWIDKYINNRAKCDTFCNHTMGAFIERYPQYIKEIKKWTKLSNRWVKRASAVSFIVPARR